MECRTSRSRVIARDGKSTRKMSVEKQRKGNVYVYGLISAAGCCNLDSAAEL